VFFNGHAYTSDYYAYQMPLTNGAEINTLVAAANSACPNQSSPFLGYIFDSFNGAENSCNPITALSFGPMVSDPTVLGSRTFWCTGPSSVHLEFAGGSFDAQMSYYYSGYARTAGCYEKTTTATLTIHNQR
jgi:hypothetical protein